MVKKQFTSAHSMYIAEIGEYEIFSPEEEKEYFTAYQNETDPVKKLEIRNEILQANLKLVIAYVRKYYSDDHVEKLELISEGNIGLMKAIEHFDVDKGYKFSTYATWWVMQSISRYLSNYSSLVRIPVNAQYKINKMKKYINEYRLKNHEYPSDEQIAKAIELTESQIRELRKIDTTIVSLDASVNQDEDGGSTLGDFCIDETAPAVEDNCLKTEFKEKLEKILDEKLTKREKEILKYRYGFGDKAPMTLEQVGNIYGVTRERIRQIEAKAFRKLKKSSRVSGLSELYNDYR